MDDIGESEEAVSEKQAPDPLRKLAEETAREVIVKFKQMVYEGINIIKRTEEPSITEFIFSKLREAQDLAVRAEREKQPIPMFPECPEHETGMIFCMECIEEMGFLEQATQWLKNRGRR